MGQDAAAGGELRRRLSRERLWKLNDELEPVKRALEYEAVALGWLARMPGPSITRMTGIGIGIAVVGAGIIWASASSSR